jgi:hypothetical protein
MTLGTLTEEVWKEHVKGESWNVVRAHFPRQEPKFRKISPFYRSRIVFK